MAWTKLGTNTLTSPADDISNTITGKKLLQYMLMKINTGGAVNPTLTFNSDSASNYAYRYASNGAADVPLVNQSKIEMTKSGATPTSLVISYSINISTEEKLIIVKDVESFVIQVKSGYFMKNIFSKARVSNVIAGSTIIFTIYAVVFQVVNVDSLLVLSTIAGFSSKHLFDSRQTE